MHKKLAFIASLAMLSSVMVLPFQASAVTEGISTHGVLEQTMSRASSTATMKDAQFSLPVQYLKDRGFMTSKGKMNATISFVMDDAGTEVTMSSSTKVVDGSPYYVVSGDTITFHTGKVGVVPGSTCYIKAVQPQDFGGITVNKTTILMNYLLTADGTAVSFTPLEDGSDYYSWEQGLGDITTIQPILDSSLKDSFSDVINGSKWYVFFQVDGEWYYVDAVDLTKSEDEDGNTIWKTSAGKTYDTALSSSSDSIVTAKLPEGVTTCYYGFQNKYTKEYEIPYVATLTVSEDKKSATTSTTGYASNMFKLYCDSSLEGKYIKVYEVDDEGNEYPQQILVDKLDSSGNKTGSYTVLDSGNNGKVTAADSQKVMYVPTTGNIVIKVYDSSVGTDPVFTKQICVSNVLQSGTQYVKPNVTLSYAASNLTLGGLSTDSNTYYVLTLDGENQPTSGYQNADSKGTITFNDIVPGNTYYLWQAVIGSNGATISDSPIGTYTDEDFSVTGSSDATIKYYTSDEDNATFIKQYGTTLRETPDRLQKWDFSSQGTAIVTTVTTVKDPTITVEKVTSTATSKVTTTTEPTTTTAPVVTAEPTVTSKVTYAPVVVTDEAGSVYTNTNGAEVTAQPLVVTDSKGDPVVINNETVTVAPVVVTDEVGSAYTNSAEEVVTAQPSIVTDSNNEPVVTDGSAVTVVPVAVTDENGSAYTKPNGEVVTQEVSVVTDSKGDPVIEDGVAVTTVPELEYKPDYQTRYDLNSDGEVDFIDLLLLKKKITESLSATELRQKNYYDINGDGAVNIVDVCTLKAYIFKNKDSAN